jgi:hypothetical protein
LNAVSIHATNTKIGLTKRALVSWGLPLRGVRKSQAVSYALSFFWLDGFAVPALVVELVVEPGETLSRHNAGIPFGDDVANR